MDSTLSQQKFVATISASDSGKSIMEDAAIQVAVNHLSDVGPEISILF